MYRMNHTIIRNKRIILIVIGLSLSGLIVLVTGLASNIASAQFPPPSSELSSTQISSSTNKTCSLPPSLIKIKSTPQQTEGPYFVEGMPKRSDIRSDPSDGLVQQGIPLRLILHVYDVDNGSCIPLNGSRVDIWHANSQGVYSGVNDQSTPGKKFLRGYQVTDDNGIVRFITIYPGCTRVELFTYTSKSTRLRDWRKLWNGHRSFTLRILSTHRCTLNPLTVTMDLPT